MKANPSNLLESLSNNDVTFFIPPYQRNYEWTESTCRVFLSDIQAVATSNAEGEYSEHFFGSIVYVVEDSGFGLPDRYVLTDGQQRITTSMLFLMALRDCVQDNEYKATIQKRYLENERATDGTEYKIKLKQVETDWEAYKLLALAKEVPKELRNSAVFRNYQLFRRSLEPMGQPAVKNLLEKGLMKFSIISIQLEPDRNPWENPQEIFESMNSLGKPLSLADLVRNYLLMGKSSTDQTKLYNEFWLALEKRLPGRLSEFIRDWMQADQHRSFKVARETNYKELYGAFKDIVSDRKVEQLFDSFVRFSQPYSQASGLEKTGDKTVDQALEDLHVIGVGPALSFLAELLAAWSDSKLSSDALVRILVSVRTYLLRRRILVLAAPENKFFPVLGARLQEIASADDVTEAIFTQLADQEYVGRLPNDDELKSRLEGMNFYNFGRDRSHPRLLLSLIEEHFTKSRPRWDDGNLQLEHIMPQVLSAGWRAALGHSAEEVHRKLVNNIGNITLIRHNQELGNKTFEVKKEAYAGKSGLQVAQNKVLDCDSWDSDAIVRRTDFLTEILLDHVLAIPDTLKHSSNWRQGKQRERRFDARQIMNQLIGDTIHFVSNPRVTATVISDSKVSFEGKEWSLGPLTRELKQREGEISKHSRFQGASYWTLDGTRLVDLHIEDAVDPYDHADVAAQS